MQDNYMKLYIYIAIPKNFQKSKTWKYEIYINIISYNILESSISIDLFGGVPPLVRRTFLGLPGLQQLGLGLAADAIGLEDLMDFAPDLQHGVLSGVVIPGRTRNVQLRNEG